MSRGVTAVNVRDLSVCSSCKSADGIIMDYSQGLLTCRMCGLVQQSNCFNDSQEWRTFSDSMGGKESERNRIGGVIEHPLFDTSGGNSMSTYIAGHGRPFVAGGGGGEVRNRAEVADAHTMSRAMQVARDVSRALNLPERVLGRCRDILVEMSESGILRARASTPWALAVLYMSCRIEKCGRSIKDLLIACPTVEPEEVAKHYWRLDKLLATQSQLTATQASSANVGSQSLLPDNNRHESAEAGQFVIPNMAGPTTKAEPVLHGSLVPTGSAQAGTGSTLKSIAAATKVNFRGSGACEQFINKFCSRLGVPQLSAKATELVTKANQYGFGVSNKDPVSVATASIFLTAAVTGTTLKSSIDTIEKVSKATGAKPTVAKSVFALLRGHADALLTKP